jgi:hypothetical protein
MGRYCETTAGDVGSNSAADLAFVWDLCLQRLTWHGEMNSIAKKVCVYTANLRNKLFEKPSDSVSGCLFSLAMLANNQSQAHQFAFQPELANGRCSADSYGVCTLEGTDPSRVHDDGGRPQRNDRHSPAEFPEFAPQHAASTLAPTDFDNIDDSPLSWTPLLSQQEWSQLPEETLRV